MECSICGSEKQVYAAWLDKYLCENDAEVIHLLKASKEEQ